MITWVAHAQPAESGVAYEIRSIGGHVIAWVPRDPDGVHELQARAITALPDVIDFIKRFTETPIENPSLTLKTYMDEAQKIKAKMGA